MDNSTIRVMFVLPDFASGGAQRAVSTYLKRINRDHFSPGLCLWRSDFRYEVPGDVPVWVVGKRTPWQFPGATLRTARLMREWQPDVVSSHLDCTNFSTGIALLLAGLKCPWLPCMHTDLERKTRYPEYPWIVPVLRRAIRVCGVSKGVARGITGRMGLNEERIEVLYNPIDFDGIDQVMKENYTLPAVPTIATMGRLVEAKDYGTLLRAVARVRENHPVRLLLLGEGRRIGDLEELARRLGIAGSVEFGGFLSDPFPRIAAADVFALTSRREGLPNALVEAMGCGLPCVATEYGCGPGEIVEDGRTGLLVPVGDPAAMARAIERLLENRSLRRGLGRRARARVRRQFAADRRTAAFEGLLWQVHRGTL